MNKGELKESISDFLKFDSLEFPLWFLRIARTMMCHSCHNRSWAIKLPLLKSLYRKMRGATAEFSAQSAEESHQPRVFQDHLRGARGHRSIAQRGWSFFGISSSSWHPWHYYRRAGLRLRHSTAGHKKPPMKMTHPRTARASDPPGSGARIRDSEGFAGLVQTWCVVPSA
jgi:hypothetical protein